MLEKYLKMFFSFNIKKNINVFLIILVVLIIALLFFGNFNLVEGLTCPKVNKDDVPLVGGERLENLSNNLQAMTQSCVE